jgi:hypothetical protein
MKKALKISLITLAVIFLILFTAPYLFKGKILKVVQKELNSSLNAQVSFSDFNLSLIRGFPNVYVGLENLKVVGIDTFKNDTLVSFKTFSMKVDLLSVFGESGIDVKSILLDEPVIHAIVLADGRANWDIAKPDTAAVTDTTKSEASSFNIKLKKFEIKNASISYKDASMDVDASLQGLNFLLKGDLASDKTTIDLSSDIKLINVVFGGIKYMKDVHLATKIAVDADMKNMLFTLKENELSLNDLTLGWQGTVSMPDSTIGLDLTFATKKTDFKSILSLVPAVYMKDFASVKTAGELKLDGYAKGVYSSTTMPNVGLKLLVNNAMFKYPSLPKSADNIQIDLSVFYNGVHNDSTTVDLNRFHVELGGNPFDAGLNIRTPMSDMAIKAWLKGKIDLASMKDVVPLDSMSITGIIDANVDIAGRMSMIEKEQYEQFKADGSIVLQAFSFKSNDLPQTVLIENANLLFSPRYVDLTQFNMKMGKSDFQLKGKVENFIPYVFSNGIIKGQLALNSNNIDVNEFMPQTTTETTEAPADTTQMSVIEIPANINFVFTSNIKKLIYDKLEIADMVGKIELANSKVVMNNLNMKMLQGSLGMNGEYNTQNVKKPAVDFKLNIKEFDIPSAFSAFTSLGKFAPAAKNATGKFSMSFSFSSLLDAHMSPVMQSVNGSGKFSSKSVGLKDNKIFSKIDEALKSDKFSNMQLANVAFDFEIKDGRVYLKPFDLTFGASKLNVSGDQGLDQTMNYTFNMTLPRSQFGSSFNGVVSSLVSSAASKGIKVNPGETVDVGALVSGTFSDPKVSLQLGKQSVQDFKDQAKEIVQEKVEEVKTKAKEEASKKAQELIAKAQKEADAIKATAAKSAEEIRNQAEVNAKKIEKEAANKPKILKEAAKKSADKVRSEGEKKAKALESEAAQKADAVMAKANQEADKLK